MFRHVFHFIFFFLFTKSTSIIVKWTKYSITARTFPAYVPLSSRHCDDHHLFNVSTSEKTQFQGEKALIFFHSRAISLAPDASSSYGICKIFATIVRELHIARKYSTTAITIELFSFDTKGCRLNTLLYLFYRETKFFLLFFRFVSFILFVYSSFIISR